VTCWTHCSPIEHAAGRVDVCGQSAQRAAPTRDGQRATGARPGPLGSAARRQAPAKAGGQRGGAGQCLGRSDGWGVVGCVDQRSSDQLVWGAGAATLPTCSSRSASAWSALPYPGPLPSKACSGGPLAASKTTTGWQRPPATFMGWPSGKMTTASPQATCWYSSPCFSPPGNTFRATELRAPCSGPG